jgi:hypothetical protein
LDRLNQWLMLIANLGVIAGFVFLALEIQQNSEAIKAQTYQSRTEAGQELSITIMDSEHFAPLLAKLGSGLFPADPAALAELNPEERIRLTAFQLFLRLTLDNQLYQYEQGFIDEEFFNNTTKPTMAIMTPAWEELNLLNGLRPSFLEAIVPYRTRAEN